jgi:hypothetical protein
MTELAILRRWILFNGSSTRRQTSIVMFICCQFAEDVALTGGSQPRQLARNSSTRADDAHRRIDVTPYRRSIPCEEDPAGWATGRLYATVWFHSIARRFYRALHSAQEREFSWFTCGGRPNIRACHHCMPAL